MLPPNLYARVHPLFSQSHARPRVRRAPGFPCALCFKRATKMQTRAKRVARTRNFFERHCERSEAIHCLARAERWIASLRSQKRGEAAGADILCVMARGLSRPSTFFACGNEDVDARTSPGMTTALAVMRGGAAGTGNPPPPTPKPFGGPRFPPLQFPFGNLKLTKLSVWLGTE